MRFQKCGVLQELIRMKKLTLLLIGIVIFGGCVNVNFTGQCREKGLRHVVLFKFKGDTTAEQLKDIEKSMSSLGEKIDVVCDYEWGPDINKAKRSKGFTHCVVITFGSVAERDIFLNHPAHKEAVDDIQPYIEDMLVVDYWGR